MKGNLMDAQLAARCEFTAIGQGGFPQLQAFLEDKIVKESDKIHSGPIPTTLKGLPGDEYDVSVVLSGGKDSIKSRQNVIVATDLLNKLIMDAKSTEIIGEGFGKYLKKVNGGSEVDSTNVAHEYTVTIGGAFQLEKPFIIPGGTFKSMVKQEIEKQFVKEQKKIIEELAKNI
jgi:hypothetical protein